MTKHRRQRKSRSLQAELRPSVRRHKAAIRSSLWGLGYVLALIGFFSIVYLVRFYRPGHATGTDKAQTDPSLNRTQAPTDISQLTSLFTALEESQDSPEALDRALRQEQLAVARYLVQTLPQNANALFIMAMACQEQGDSDRASQYLRQCLQVQPGRADALDQLGRIAQQQGDHDKAAALLKKALTADPALAGGHYRLAEVLQLQNKPKEALIELARHTEQHPQAADAYALQGEIHLQLQDYQQAKVNYEKAVTLNPQLPRPYFGLATACARLGLKTEAGKYRETFKAVEKLSQDVAKERRANFDPLLVTRQSAAHTHADAAQIYQAERHEALARALWERARALDPQNVTSCFSLADLHLRAGRSAEALALYEQVVTIQPQNGAAHFFIGHIHEKRGNLEAAEQAYQRVVEVNPQRPEGYLTLIRFYQETRPNLRKARLVARALTKLVPTAANFALLARLCHQLNESAPALAAVKQALEIAPHNAQYQDLYQKIQEAQ